MSWFMWTIAFTFYICLNQCSCSRLVEEVNRSLKHQFPRVRRNVKPCAGINISDNIPEGLPIVKGSKQLENKVDSFIRLPCHAYSRTPANVTWLKNGKAVDLRASNVGISYPHSSNCHQELQITYALPEDSGVYTCVVTNKFGTSKFNTSVKVIQPKPSLSIEELRLTSAKQKAILGATIELMCIIHSPGHVSAIWRKNGKRSLAREGPPGKNIRLIWNMTALATKEYEKRIFLTLKNVTAKDEGNWTCVAKRMTTIKDRTFTLVTVPCPAGHYCPWTENEAYPCTYGTYTNGSSNGTVLSASDCFQCPGIPQGTQPRGKWLPAGSLGQCPAVTCPENHYCPNRTSTIPCPQEMYFEWHNASEAADCKKCPTNDEELRKTSHSVKDRCAPSKAARNSDDRSDRRLEIVIGVALGVAVVTVIAIIALVYLKRRSHSKSSLYKSSSTKTIVTSGKVHKESCQYYQHKNTSSSSRESSLLDAEEDSIPTLYDVFITYSSKDGDWVKDLVSMLESRGFKCCIDYRDFLPGNAIVTNIAEAIYQSKRTLAVLSPDFIKSNWCQSELQHALARVRNHKVVPVIYRACVVPLELQDKTYIDWENPDVRPHFWDALERALKEKPVVCSCILERAC